jgi:hypothetical protein
MYLSETHEKKWQPVLEHPDLPEIKDSYRRAVTSVILENQERASKEDQLSCLRQPQLTQLVHPLQIGILF